MCKLGVISCFTKTGCCWNFFCSIWMVWFVCSKLHSDFEAFFLVSWYSEGLSWLTSGVWFPFFVTEECNLVRVSRHFFFDDLFVFLKCRMQRKPWGKLKQLRSELPISLDASVAVQMNGRELFQHEPWVFDNSIYWGGEMKPWELLGAWFVLPHGKL